MALQFKKENESSDSKQNASEAVSDSTNEFSIIAQREELKNQLIKNDEIDKLVSTIDVHDTSSIVKFGGQVAEEISKASDQVLNSMDMSQVNDSGALLKELSALMSKFDIKEVSADEQGFFQKLLGGAKKQLEKILAKYNTMGGEIDKIYVQLKGYETEIEASNKKLESMFHANICYYQELLKYIMAGEQGVKELQDYIAQYRQNVETNPTDGTLRMELSNLEQVENILEQRVMDLKIAENVAMQTIPMLKTMEFSNLNLIRKINSAFIITMPIFKQSLAQAIMLKRQRVQADALKALDDKTNEMLIRNAENSVAQSKMTTMLASGSSIQVETLQKTWETIVNGIEETKQIQEDLRKKRQEDSVKLNQLKEQFVEKLGN